MHGIWREPFVVPSSRLATAATTNPYTPLILSVHFFTSRSNILEKFDSMADTREESPQKLPPSLPLHIDGFLTGSTIRVQGDAGDVHFSGQFDIHQQPKTPSQQRPHFPGTDSTEFPQRSVVSVAKLLSSIEQSKTHSHGHGHGLFDGGPSPITNPSSSYITNPSTPLDRKPPPIEFPDLGLSHFDQIPNDNCQTSATTQMRGCDTGRSTAVTTRLRSGVISPVTYFPRQGCACVDKSSDHGGKSRRRRSKSKGGRGGRSSERGDVLLRVLRRHGFPVRPCNSYTFFIMTKWEMVKTSSFQETSKRLGEMWSQLPETEKKEFVKMALKDKDRYKKQCMLLNRK